MTSKDPDRLVQRTFRIPLQLAERLDKSLRWGIRGQIMTWILSDLADLLESNGPEIMALLYKKESGQKVSILSLIKEDKTE